MNNEIIICSKITKYYITLKALSDVSFTIKEGESVALVGANGSGKTTLFNIILGLLKPQEGICTVLGTDSRNIPPEIRAQTGFVSDSAGFLPWATTNEIAGLFSSLYPQWNRDKYLELIDFCRVDPYRRLNRLSKGQKRLAEIALAGSIQPKIMILDEPFNGLDAVMRIRIQNMLREFQKQQGMTILYATHILSELSSVADRMIILRSGEIVYDDVIKNSDMSPGTVFEKYYSKDISG